MDEHTIKAEPGLRDEHQMAETKPSYKSWKKKYRKMRLQFDQRMQESAELHRLEQKAIRTMKRLSVENDRLMDLLLDVNNSRQIPPERRFNLSLDDNDEETEAESTETDPFQKPSKSLKRLIEDIPHLSFAETFEHRPEVLEQIRPADPELYPTSFLNADEVDTYLAELDMRLGLRQKPMIPRLAQANAAPSSSAADFALRNPTSVYNWLRKHAPKTFLQDDEKDNDDETKDGRKRKGGAARGNKRQSATSRKEKEREKEAAAAAAAAAAAESMEWDEEVGDEIAAVGTVKGKRKRDDDPGYRPKGGSSRPSKKRKSSSARKA